MRRLREYDNKMDKHLTKKQAKEVNKDLIEDLTPDKQKQLEAQRQAKIEAELNKSSATQSDALGATIRTLLQKTFETKVDWRAIIRQYLRVAETKTQTWLKPARRGLGGGYYSPGNISNSDKFDAVFAIDTSGSIGDQPLNVFITAINEMAKQAKNINVRILLWHTEAYYMSPPITQKGALQEVFKRMHLQSGGTHIGCVPPFLVKMKVKPVVCVFLTDGYVEPSPQLAGSYQKLFIVLPMSQTVAAAKQQMENLFKHYGQVVILPSIE